MKHVDFSRVKITTKSFFRTVNFLNGKKSYQLASVSKHKIRQINFFSTQKVAKKKFSVKFSVKKKGRRGNGEILIFEEVVDYLLSGSAVTFNVL